MPLATGSMRTNQNQRVTTSISSVRANKRGTMSISSVHAQEDLSISSQRALQEEKEEEHLMGTGSDSDAKEDEDSDDGSDSEGDCFSTISIEDDAVQGEEEESLELGIDGSTEGVELRLGEIEEGSPDDVHVELVRKGAFKPCECKMCFFCVKGLTNGITHHPSKGAQVIVEYKCGTRVKTDQCTNVRVSLGMESGTYCQMCYRKSLQLS